MPQVSSTAALPILFYVVVLVAIIGAVNNTTTS